MIHLFFGGDDLALHEALSSMKKEVRPAELRDVNITVLQGHDVSPDQLLATCATVPFLAEKRMVIVEGLLSLFEVRTPSRTGTRTAPHNSRLLPSGMTCPGICPTSQRPRSWYSRRGD